MWTPLVVETWRGVHGFERKLHPTRVFDQPHPLIRDPHFPCDSLAWAAARGSPCGGWWRLCPGSPGGRGGSALRFPQGNGYWCRNVTFRLEGPFSSAYSFNKH